MRLSFNFFQEKLKSSDNYKYNKKNKLDLKSEKSIMNNAENSFRLVRKKSKKKNLIDKELSSISNLKFMNSLINSNRKNSVKEQNKNGKKKSVESLFGEKQQQRKSYANPNIIMRIPEFIKINNFSNKRIYHSSNKSSKDISSNKTFSTNSNISSIESVKVKKPKFLELKTPTNEFYMNRIGKTPKNNNYNNGLYKNYVRNFFRVGKSKHSESSKALKEKTNFSNYNYFNNMKMMKLNQHIQNELDSMELKRKVKIMKKTIVQLKSSNDLKYIIEEENFSQTEDKEKSENTNKDINENNEKKENKDESNLCLKEKKIDKDEKHLIKDKGRILKRTKEIYDSFDDEEYEDENDVGYYISPNSYFIKIFDCIIFIASMIYLIFVPYIFSTNSIIFGDNKIHRLILILIDIIYILDIIINSFRAYQDFDEKLVRKKRFIFLHYLKGWFLLDLIQCIPIFTFFKYLERICRKYNNKICTLEGNNFYIVDPILYLIILLKIIKVYKMVNDNTTLSKIGEFLTRNETIDNYGNFIFSIFFSFCFLNLCACLFIFIGKNSYPGWLMKIDIQDESYINIYVTSVYFILVTITTVGYGDITGNSYSEIVYQMFLLIIGTIAYSFVISYISNYIVKINQKSMNFEKNLGILEEIRLHNPHLKNSVYQEVLKNLHNEQLYEKNDKSLLFDCLPYTLKNKLIMEMYKPFIENFIFFKDNENSDFIVKVVTSLKPLLSFKNDVLIQEGDYIKEIFFVKKGALALNIAINKENPEQSVDKYLDVNNKGNLKISYMPPSIMSSNQASSTFNLERLNTYLLNKREDKDETLHHSNLNIQEMKIIEIRTNEHFGDALMFLNERCPLIVRVKTKIAELLVLRKMEAIEIYSVYPNIWKRINKKSLYNMEQIKLKIKKNIFYIAKKYGDVAGKKIINNSKSLKKFLSISTTKNNNNIINWNINHFNNNNDNNNTQNQNKNKNKKKKNKNKSKKNVDKNKEKSENIENENNINNEINENNEKSENNENKEKNKNEDTTPKISINIIDENNNKIGNKQYENKINNKILSENFFSSRGVSSIKSPTNDKSILNSENKNISNVSKMENLDKTKDKCDEKEEEKVVKISENKSNIVNNSFLNNKNQKKTIQKNDQRYMHKNYTLNKKNKNNFSIITNLKKKNDDNDNSSNISNESSNSSQKEKNISNIYNDNEKLFFNSFSNLTITTQKSFQLNSSYENINKITNNKYIKDVILQSRTKQFLVNECSSINNESQIKNVLLLKNPVNGQIIISKNKSFMTNDGNLEDDKKSYNSIDLSKMKLSNNKLPEFSEKNITKINRHESFKNNLNEKQLKFNETPKLTKCKSPKKKKNNAIGVNHKLDLITKNIKGANKNINNPEEFYMDFFNNIIKQETKVILNKDDKKINNIIDNIQEKNKNNDIIGKLSLNPNILNHSNSAQEEDKKKTNYKTKIDKSLKKLNLSNAK